MAILSAVRLKHRQLARVHDRDDEGKRLMMK